MATIKYIRSLDGVRAIAILLVMAFHAGLINFGWVGVQLFFVLSGYLIIGILWKEKFLAQQPVAAKMKRFWIRRSLRIFPLYFAFVFLLGITYIVFHFPGTFKEYFPGLVTYTFNFSLHLPEKEGPFFTFLWSLSIEEQFYLFFPAIIFFFPPKVIKFMMITVIALSPVIRFIIGEHFINTGMNANVVANKVYWNTFSHLDAFFLGGIIPVLSLDTKIKKPLTLFFVCLIAVLAGGLYQFINSPSGPYYINDLGYTHGLTDNYAYVWQYTLLNALFFSTILVLVNYYTNTRFKKIHKFLESKWMVQIGKVSYGMYIYHFGILLFLYGVLSIHDNMLAKIALFIPYTILVYFISWISFTYFESWFLKYKDILSRPPEDKTKEQKEKPVIESI